MTLGPIALIVLTSLDLDEDEVWLSLIIGIKNIKPMTTRRR